MVLRLMVPEACASMAASASGGNMDLRRLVAVAAAAEAGAEEVVEATLDVAGVGLAPAILTGAAMATLGDLSAIGRSVTDSTEQAEPLIISRWWDQARRFSGTRWCAHVGIWW